MKLVQFCIALTWLMIPLGLGVLIAVVAIPDVGWVLFVPVILMALNVIYIQQYRCPRCGKNKYFPLRDNHIFADIDQPCVHCGSTDF